MKSRKRVQLSLSGCFGQFSDGGYERVELVNELVCVNAVGSSGRFERLAGGKCTAEAVHTDLLELGHCLGVSRKHLRDYTFSCDLHSFLLLKANGTQRASHLFPDVLTQACPSLIFAKHSLQ